MSRIVVIGGSGHVGSYLIPQLVELGHEVVNVTRGNAKPYRPHYAWQHIENVSLDRVELEKKGEIVRLSLLARAIALLQSGTALAFVVAPPLGSFLGNIIGWRGAFFTIVPVGIICLIWQLITLPALPSQGSSARIGLKPLMNNRHFMLGMVAVTFAFMGQFALSTYMRPFLESVTHLSIDGISSYLLGIGVAGLVGTSVCGKFLNDKLVKPLFLFQLVLAVVNSRFPWHRN